MQNKSFLINLGVVLVAAFIGFSFIYKPLSGEQARLRQKLSDTKDKNNILANISQIESRMDSYEKMIGGDKTESWLIGKVSDIANTAKIKLLSVEPQRRQTIVDYSKISVKVDTECSYHSLGKFVSLLESSPDLLKVDRVEIKVAGERRGEASAESYSPDMIDSQQLPVASLIVTTYNKR